MTTDFDPYYVWLGIPSSQQPADDYRLLGLAFGESDPQVIANAADRQMAHIRTYQHGPHMAESQRLLNELAAATGRLLHPVVVVPPSSVLPPPRLPPMPVQRVDAEEPIYPVRSRHVFRRRRSILPEQNPAVVAIEVFSGGIAGIILGAVLIAAMGFDLRQLFGF